MNERDKALTEFLNEVKAVELWTIAINQSLVTKMYAANGRTFIVQKFDDGAGWELYVQASASNTIEATLTAARRRLLTARRRL